MQSFKKDWLLFLYSVVYPKMLLISESSFQQVTDRSYKSPTKPLQNPPTYFLRQNAAHSVKKYIGWIHNVFFRRSIALLSSHSLHKILWKHRKKHWKSAFLSTISTPTSSHGSVALPRWKGQCVPYYQYLLVNRIYRSACGLVLMKQMLPRDSYGELFLEHALVVQW